MPGPWDSLMKRLVGAKPRHFANWLAAEAIYVRPLDIELKSQHLFADALLEIIVEGQQALLHIEFQTDRDAEMGIRLLEYNVLASRQYERLPVYSYVIYLRPDGEAVQSPYIRKLPDGQEGHRFYFRTMKLWEQPAELMLQLDLAGLLPLVTLTSDGKRPEVVKVMIDRLASEGEADLLAIARVLGGLAFKKEDEREWFRKRFSMFQDILRESWVYQEIGQEFLEKGREEERQRQSQTLMSFVQRHFPEIAALAKQQTEEIEDPEVLQTVILKLLAAQTAEEAKQILLGVDKGEQKH